MFQAMVDKISSNLIAEGNISVYIHNIIIHTRTQDKHRWITKEVLHLLQKHKLYVQLEKYKIERSEIKYLGLIISEGQICKDPVGTMAIAEWPKPKKLKELQQFLGFCNFYWQYIKGDSGVVKPLTFLTGKDHVLQWRCKTTYIPNRESTMEVGGWSRLCIWMSEDTSGNGTHPCNPSWQCTILTSGQFIRLCPRCCLVPEAGQQMVPHHIPLWITKSSRTKLWNIQQGDASNNDCPQQVASSSTWSCTGVQNMDWPPKLNVFQKAPKTKLTTS